jgi:hypothetical protein
MTSAVALLKPHNNTSQTVCDERNQKVFFVTKRVDNIGLHFGCTVNIREVVLFGSSEQ